MYLNPKHFYLPVVDLSQTTGRPDVSRLCGYADVNCDLEVVLLLADESLVSGRVVEAFIGVHAVGRRSPGEEEDLTDEADRM